MFFGTPHSGTDGVALLQILNQLRAVYLQTTDTILQHLRANSSELENIQSSYLWASKRLKTVCFYEEYQTHIVGGQRKLVFIFNMEVYGPKLCIDRTAALRDYRW